MWSLILRGPTPTLPTCSRVAGACFLLVPSLALPPSHTASLFLTLAAAPHTPWQDLPLPLPSHIPYLKFLALKTS